MTPSSWISVLKQVVAGRYDDARFDYGTSNVDDVIIVRCWRGKKYGLTHIHTADLLAVASGSEEELCRRLVAELDYVYRLAGTPLSASVPFRIGTRSPKRLRVRKEAA